MKYLEKLFQLFRNKTVVEKLEKIATDSAILSGAVTSVLDAEKVALPSLGSTILHGPAALFNIEELILSVMRGSRTIAHGHTVDCNTIAGITSSVAGTTASVVSHLHGAPLSDSLFTGATVGTAVKEGGAALCSLVEHKPTVEPLILHQTGTHPPKIAIAPARKIILRGPQSLRSLARAEGVDFMENAGGAEQTSVSAAR